MTLMVRIAPDMRLLVLPPLISSYSPKSGLELCLITEEPSSTKKKKKKKINKQSTQQCIQIRKTQINKNRLNTLKTGSPVKSPFFCSGEILRSKPLVDSTQYFVCNRHRALLFPKEKGKERKTQSLFLKQKEN